MAGFGEKLWEMGSSREHLSVLVVGLVALLTGRVVTALLNQVAAGPARTAMATIALALSGIGVFFVALALFLGSYTASGESWQTTIWRIAQLLAAVLVLVFLV